MSKRPKVAGKTAPTGRTTSPPAPRHTRDSTPHASNVDELKAATPMERYRDPVGIMTSHDAVSQHLTRPKQVVPSVKREVYPDLRIQQVITNAAAKGEQFEMGPPAISCVAFDSTGNYLAYADRAGRCYIFCRNGEPFASLTPNPEPSPAPNGYTLIDVVEAYQPQLDTLNSTEIEAKVNVLKFVNMGNGSVFFLTSNDKTIKMWKIWERKYSQPEEYEPVEAILDDWKYLKFPKVQPGQSAIWHKETKVFAADHEYHVNSISTSSGGETFLSSDDLTVQLWHLGHHEHSLRILDRRPEHMEELSETITSSTFHTFRPQEFCVANSKGIISVYDMRTNLTCQDACQTLSGPPPSGPNVYLSSILAGISSVKYSTNGIHVIARDYLNVRIWDTRKSDLPINTHPVHSNIEPRLNELYEHDYVFDRFDVVTNPSGSAIFTGSYRSEFVQFNQNSSSRLYTTDMSETAVPLDDPNGAGAAVRPDAYEDHDFLSKTLQLDCHPTEDLLAVGCGHELFLCYSE